MCAQCYAQLVKEFRELQQMSKAQSALQESGDKPYMLLVRNGHDYTIKEFATLQDALDEYSGQYSFDVIIAKRLDLRVRES
jgi:hypothetical protein